MRVVGNGVATDGDLIVRIADGDRNAFEELYRRYARPVLGLAYVTYLGFRKPERVADVARVHLDEDPATETDAPVPDPVA